MTALPGEAAREAALRRDLAARRAGRWFMWVVPIGAFVFLWVPIVVLVVFSFNDAESVSVWRGASLRWYQNLFGAISGDGRFQSDLLLQAVRNSLVVAGARR